MAKLVSVHALLVNNRSYCSQLVNFCILLKLATKILFFLCLRAKNEFVWRGQIHNFLVISLASLGSLVLTSVSSPFKWETNFH